MTKKMGIVLSVLVMCFTCFTVPFSANAAEVFTVGNPYTKDFNSPDMADNSTGMLVRVTITPYQPTLLNYDIEKGTDSATINFLNSSGVVINGSISQSGRASLGLNYVLSGGGFLSAPSSTGSQNNNMHFTPTSNSSYISGLNFSGLPTKASIDYSSSETALYLYEEKFDVSIQIFNLKYQVMQFDNSLADISFTVDTTHIVGTSCGGDIVQLDTLGDLSVFKVDTSINDHLTFHLTTKADYIYNNRITLPNRAVFSYHGLISNYVLRTSTTTAQPVINSVTVGGISRCKQYDEVDPSVLWNLYYINNKLDSMLGTPSNNASTNNIVNDTTSTINQQHQQESTYFNSAESSLADSGISNFKFDGGITNGLSNVRQDFSNLWLAISDWKWVYLFTLFMLLATHIIRHIPPSKGD